MGGARLEVRPLSGAIGAEVFGADLSGNLDDALIAEIRQALLDHLVIFFRDQELTPDRQLDFARRFGDPVEYPFVKGLDGYPLIVPVVKLEHETVNFGGIWHSDTAYLPEPPMGTILYARELPPFGGDTLFANMYMAYETLSSGMKALLDDLVAVNTSEKADVSRTREDRIKDAPKDASDVTTTAEHPVVRTHPETGRKALYVNVAHTAKFKGFTERESAPILNYLFQHQTRPEFTCRFRWQPGSLAFWDNRAAQHNPVNDYHGYRRVLHRITLAGERPN
ncbi:MAG: TauD/TfdA family dioxygenase [Minwuiales bacterium]|nr:TauD/TfdA family dioxygenase [Minwuiales bacterium]